MNDVKATMRQPHNKNKEWQPAWLDVQPYRKPRNPEGSHTRREIHIKDNISGTIIVLRPSHAQQLVDEIQDILDDFEDERIGKMTIYNEPRNIGSIRPVKTVGTPISQRPF